MNRPSWLAGNTLAEMTLGALVFWLPDLVIHAARGSNFSSADVTIVTVASPLLSFFFLALIWRKGIAYQTRWRRVVLPVFGIWVWGPLMISVSATFGGGGFATADAWQTLRMMTLFPIFDFIGSTYDGSLGALTLVTLCLPLLGFAVLVKPVDAKSLSEEQSA